MITDVVPIAIISIADGIYQKQLEIQTVTLYQSKEECSVLKVCGFCFYVYQNI